LLFDRSGEFRKISASDRAVHLGLADAADRSQFRDFFRARRDVHQILPRRPGRATSEAIELSETAFLAPPLLALGYERLEGGAVHKDRPAIVDRLETVLEPMPDRVAMNSEELRDLGRFIAARLFDPVGWIVASVLARPRFHLMSHQTAQTREREAIRSEIQESISSSTQATQRFDIETGGGKRSSRT
jgi:hypothetical protein